MYPTSLPYISGHSVKQYYCLMRSLSTSPPGILQQSFSVIQALVYNRNLHFGGGGSFFRETPRIMCMVQSHGTENMVQSLTDNCDFWGPHNCSELLVKSQNLFLKQHLLVVPRVAWKNATIPFLQQLNVNVCYGVPLPASRCWYNHFWMCWWPYESVVQSPEFYNVFTV